MGYEDKIFIDSSYSVSMPDGKKLSDFGELELKHELKEINLSTEGNRDELEKRLTDYFRESSREHCKNVIKKFFDNINCDISLIFNVTITTIKEENASQNTQPQQIKKLHLITDRLPEKSMNNISTTM